MPTIPLLPTLVMNFPTYVWDDEPITLIESTSTGTVHSALLAMVLEIWRTSKTGVDCSHTALLDR